MMPIVSSTGVAVIPREEVEAAVSVADALASSRDAFRASVTGAVQQPFPLQFTTGSSEGDVHVKSAVVSGQEFVAVKIATGFTANSRLGLPTGYGVVVLIHVETGAIVAVFLDDGFLTDLRTGAAGAVACELLAPDRIESVAIVGAGAQARRQAQCLASIRRWNITQIWGRDVSRTHAAANAISESTTTPVRVCASVREAVVDADVIISVTPARDGWIVSDDWVRKGATIIAVGADTPEKQELDPRLLRRATHIVVDSRSQAARLGELHHAIESSMVADLFNARKLGEFVGGRLERGPDELVVCDLTGLGAQDTTIANVAWKNIQSKRERENEVACA